MSKQNGNQKMKRFRVEIFIVVVGLLLGCSSENPIESGVGASATRESESTSSNNSKDNDSTPHFTIAPDSSSPYRLAYTHSTNNEILVAGLNTDTMRLEGEKLLVDNDSGANWYPAVSPDGTKIAFYSDRDGFPHLFLIGDGNSEPTAIQGNYVTGPPPKTKFLDNLDEMTLSADLLGSYGAPAWSPDGSKVAYSAYDPNRVSAEVEILMNSIETRAGNADIVVVPVGSSGQVVNLTDNPSFDGAPSWSPDGSKIAFNTNRDGTWEIYVMNSDGSNPTRLTHSAGSWFPSWSPDGSRIVYCSKGSGHTRPSISIMNADGSNMYELIQDDENSLWRPTWSPDGKYITWVKTGGINPGYAIHIWDMATAQEWTTHVGHLPSWFPLK